MLSSATYTTHSADETVALGHRIAAELGPRAVVLLIGNLGAGKTTLTQGIIEGLGVASRDEVASPTFTLIHEYGPNVYHIDLYRLDTEAEVETLGLDDLFDREAIILIEWGERFPRLMPQNRYEIRLKTLENDEEREIEITTRSTASLPSTSHPTTTAHRKSPDPSD